MKYDYQIKVRPSELKNKIGTCEQNLCILKDLSNTECFSGTPAPQFTGDFSTPVPEKIRNMLYSVDQSNKQTRIQSALVTGARKNRDRNILRKSETGTATSFFNRTDHVHQLNRATMNASSGFEKKLNMKIQDMELASTGSPCKIFDEKKYS